MATTPVERKLHNYYAILDLERHETFFVPTCLCVKWFGRVMQKVPCLVRDEKERLPENLATKMTNIICWRADSLAPKKSECLRHYQPNHASTFIGMGIRGSQGNLVSTDKQPLAITGIFILSPKLEGEHTKNGDIVCAIEHD